MMKPQQIHEKDLITYDTAAIIVRNLYKSFGQQHVLQDFNMHLNKGENLVLLGKSGAGKSVLIKCIIGLLTPDSGSIEVFGKSVLGLDVGELDMIRAKVGFLFQNNALYDSMTIRENLEFPLRRHWMHLTQTQIDEMVMQALDDVGLGYTVDKMPAELSGGMRKRVALARTLILQPHIILYDEPTTGLDTITGKEIIELMVKIQKKYNTSSLIISHDMNVVKMAADRVVVLWEGKLYAEGTYDQLRNDKDEIIKMFFE